MASQTNRVINEEAALSERRAGVRTRTVYRTGRIVGRDDCGLCRILNLADGGALIETGIAIDAGDEAWIELAEGTTVDAIVAWRDGQRAGLRFFPEIDSLATLKQLADERWNGRWRPARLPVNKLVEVTSELGSSILRLKNISQHGLRLRDSGNLTAGMPLSVRLSADLLVHGVVRWTRGRDVGVELQGMIAVSVLMSAAAFESS